MEAIFANKMVNDLLLWNKYQRQIIIAEQEKIIISIENKKKFIGIEMFQNSILSLWNVD